MLTALRHVSHQPRGGERRGKTKTQSDYVSSWQLPLTLQTTAHVEDRRDPINALIKLPSAGRWQAQWLLWLSRGHSGQRETGFIYAAITALSGKIKDKPSGRMFFQPSDSLSCTLLGVKTQRNRGSRRHQALINNAVNVQTSQMLLTDNPLFECSLSPQAEQPNSWKVCRHLKVQITRAAAHALDVCEPA